jgi:hypothetical protein
MDSGSSITSTSTANWILGAAPGVIATDSYNNSIFTMHSGSSISAPSATLFGNYMALTNVQINIESGASATFGTLNTMNNMYHSPTNTVTLDGSLTVGNLLLGNNPTNPTLGVAPTNTFTKSAGASLTVSSLIAMKNKSVLTLDPTNTSITAANIFIDGTVCQCRGYHAEYQHAHRPVGHDLTLTKATPIAMFVLNGGAYNIGAGLKLVNTSPQGAAFVQGAGSKINVGLGSTLQFDGAMVVEQGATFDPPTNDAGGRTVQFRGMFIGGNNVGTVGHVVLGNPNDSYKFVSPDNNIPLNVGTLSGSNADLTITGGATLNQSSVAMDSNVTVGTVGTGAIILGDLNSATSPGGNIITNGPRVNWALRAGGNASGSARLEGWGTVKNQAGGFTMAGRVIANGGTGDPFAHDLNLDIGTILNRPAIGGEDNVPGNGATNHGWYAKKQRQPALADGAGRVRFLPGVHHDRQLGREPLWQPRRQHELRRPDRPGEQRPAQLRLRRRRQRAQSRGREDRAHRPRARPLQPRAGRAVGCCHAGRAHLHQRRDHLPLRRRRRQRD